MKRTRVSDKDSPLGEVFARHIRSEQHKNNQALPIGWRVIAGNILRFAELVFPIIRESRNTYFQRVILEQKGLKAAEPGLLVGAEKEDLENQNLVSVYLMLVGMAIECLLKGLIVDKSHGTKIDKTHDLIKLAMKAGVICSDREAELLSIMSDHIEWKGRYPAPISLENFYEIASTSELSRPARSFECSSLPIIVNQHGDDHDVIKKLIIRLINMY